MTRRSPLTVTYKSIQELAEEMLRDAEARYAGAQARFTSNLEPLRFRVENAKALVRMLKRCEPGKQADMYELFKQSVK
jgi:hypothetical protein